MKSINDFYGLEIKPEYYHKIHPNIKKNGRYNCDDSNFNETYTRSDNSERQINRKYSLFQIIMKNIKINILDFCGNNHWHYEILIDDKRFISGWWSCKLPYTYHILEHFPNGVTEHQRKILNNKYALIEFTSSYWARCFTQEAIDLVIEKIYESYKAILDKQ